MLEETVIHEGFAAEARLGTLGLELEQLLRVVTAGEFARADATFYDPITAAGTNAYQARVRTLREVFCPHGWELARRNGLELIVAASGSHSIITRGGDAAVGLKDAIPQPKGEIGDGAAALLNGTLPLFETKWLQSQGATRPQHEIWMLLVHASPTTVRSELSLGSEISDKSVSFWFERIILPELDPNNLTGRRRDQSDETRSDALDVPVIRKKQA
ncbi:MAG: hypothetical protein ACOYXR_05675 [Nitrospirota bacterium]